VVGVVGGGETAEVRDIFVERLLAIQGKVGKQLVGVVLRDEAGRDRVEMRQIGGFPPISHTPCRINRAAFSVKRMADFVPNGDTDNAIVHGGVCLRVEERGLEHCGGESHRVLQGQLHRVHSQRRVYPLFAINQMAETGDIAVVIKQAAASQVAENVIRLDFVGGVVAPSLRVTDSHIESIELGLGFSLGRRVHP
jgi:hypothetical protein